MNFADEMMASIRVGLQRRRGNETLQEWTGRICDIDLADFEPIPCRDVDCRHYDSQLEHFLHDHAQMDEIAEQERQ